MALKILQSAASNPGPGTAFRDADYQLTDRRRLDKLIEVRLGGTPTFTLQVEQSLDGHVWHAVGDAIAAAGFYERTVGALLQGRAHGDRGWCGDGVQRLTPPTTGSRDKRVSGPCPN